MLHRGTSLLLVSMALLPLVGCAHTDHRMIEVTAYCGCGECCGYYRGHWWLAHLDFWNRYIDYGPDLGQPYSGLTASGTKPRVPQPGLVSLDTVAHPWMLPFRVVFPWCWLPQKGTLAADTQYYPFGTEMFVPGYGWGIVEDRGGAIQGPNRLDTFHSSHSKAMAWGRQHLEVTIR